MTIQEAIKVLEEKEKTNDNDDKVKLKLLDIITDLKGFMNSPERGGSYAIPESVEKLIPVSRVDQNLDGIWAGKLQQAILNMIHGWKSKLPYGLFTFTLLFAVIGIVVPLIFGKLNNDMWYFSIESAKDIIGVVFDGGAVVCATALPFQINKAKREFRGISSIILILFGILGVFFTSLFAYLIPFSGGKIYYTIFECISIIFLIIGIVITWPKKAQRS